MRGDRPFQSVGFSAFLQATPHARGSTALRRLDDTPDRGYPACAGIDPMGVFLDRLSVGLPRMRGDRPCLEDVKAVQEKATPHARGSTLSGDQKVTLSGGYPACAGIDLTTDPYRPVVSRLPRMRGDRPLVTLPVQHVFVATPHARGSTSCPPPSVTVFLGYPACAGIDLRLEEGRAEVIRLPRMRGDRP